MRDQPEIIRAFVKIVQRYPEVYDTTVDSYRMHGCQNRAWLRIRNCVKTELNEECTAEEAKQKWRGVRSSYNRYLNKVQNSIPARKYYLYDILGFLAPFVSSKCVTAKPNNSAHPEFTQNDENLLDLSDFEEVDVKPSVVKKVRRSSPETERDMLEDDDSKPSSCDDEKESGTPTANEDNDAGEVENDTSEDSSDLMNFFRSIVPDLKKFTPKEKRKFKMGVLGLIDVIEDQRK